MNDNDKTFLLAFYNSFLKIELNSDEENILILKYLQFSKEDVF